jgi:hypothetical protein
MDAVDVIDILGETEAFNANTAECCDKGLPATEYADNMVRFFTDGPMLPLVQAALAKAVQEERDGLQHVQSETMTYDEQ